MRAFILFLVWGVPVLTPSISEAAPIAEARDRVGESIGPEAQAIIDLATLIEVELASGALSLSEEAQGLWPQGKAVWDAIKTLSDAGDYGAAFRTARQGRRTMRRALREVFETGRPSKEVGAGLRAYVEAVEPRIKALDHQFANYDESNEARESFFVSRAVWASAEKSVKRKKWDAAFRELQDALAEMDKVVYDVYPRAR